MPWHAHLQVDYTLEGGRCTVRHRHEGPMRILQTLYPEGEAIAHNVLVHPPGGLVGGDTVAIDVRAASGTHAVITTPGAARFYRSEGEPATQAARLEVADGARLEWLPLEALCYDGCLAENRLVLDLAPGGEVLGWDVTALGLPAAGLPFVRGSLLQHLELPGRWLERGRIAADDARLLDGPLGMAGHRCIATLYFARGGGVAAAARERLLEAAQRCIADAGLAAGVTSPHPDVVVLRVLAEVVEPAMALLKRVRGAWREAAWQLGTATPRIWAM